LCFSSYRHNPPLPSFPTRRSSDLCLVAGLHAAGLPDDAIQLVPTTDRAAVGAMLTGLDGNIDVIVPRGGKSLVARVQEEARVPVDRKSTRLNSSHSQISYAVFCLK